MQFIQRALGKGGKRGGDVHQLELPHHSRIKKLLQTGEKGYGFCELEMEAR